MAEIAGAGGAQAGGAQAGGAQAGGAQAGGAAAGGAQADGAGEFLAIRERVALTTDIDVLVTGRVVDPDESGTDFGVTNLADHVGDDPQRVADRRARLAATVGVAAGALVFARAEHGVTIVPMEGAADSGQPGDGVITAHRDLALMAMAADCVPFAVADPTSGAFAAVHAGWRGTAAGIVARVLEAFVVLAAQANHARGREGDLSNLRCYLGPAICGRCYPVGPEVVAALARVTPGDRWRATTAQGAPGVDLRQALTAQLIAGGVAPQHIGQSSACTFEDEGFFSHRRDGHQPTGRHALVVRRVVA